MGSECESRGTSEFESEDAEESSGDEKTAVRQENKASKESAARVENTARQKAFVEKTPRVKPGKKIPQRDTAALWKPMDSAINSRGKDSKPPNPSSVSKTADEIKEDALIKSSQQRKEANIKAMLGGR